MIAHESRPEAALEDLAGGLICIDSTPGATAAIKRGHPWE